MHQHLKPQNESATSETQQEVRETTSNTASPAFEDKRVSSVVQRKRQDLIRQSPRVEALKATQNTIQRQKNNTGLPNQLKSGIENLSGFSMDDVKVHYNSSQPAQLNAHAYAQGNQIHLGPGQEKHLPHEAWHVVQQKQGRVRPTMQLKGKVAINDDVGLEKEATKMGEKAMKAQQREPANPDTAVKNKKLDPSNSPIQGDFELWELAKDYGIPFLLLTYLVFKFGKDYIVNWVKNWMKSDGKEDAVKKLKSLEEKAKQKQEPEKKEVSRDTVENEDTSPDMDKQLEEQLEEKKPEQPIEKTKEKVQDPTSEGGQKQKEETSNKDPLPDKVVPKPEPVHRLESLEFMTIEELLELMGSLSLGQIYASYYELEERHAGDNDKPINLKVMHDYLWSEFDQIKEAIELFNGNMGYRSSKEPYIHDLFGNLTLTLYPIEGNNPGRDRKSAKEKVHRPILEIEIVHRQAYARCYIGLYGQAAKGSDHKDITADDSGKINIHKMGLMNVGNPFKALLWCEDYLNSTEHFKNSSKDPEPKPVVRSFLVPLKDVEDLFYGINKFEGTRPLDQDRGSGQFGHATAKENIYGEALNPLIGSLVSFYHDLEEFKAASEKGQKKYGLVNLQEYLTGQRGDVRSIAVKGVAAQHNRGGHTATFGEGYETPMVAYFDSVDTTDTQFTAATKSPDIDRRRSLIPEIFNGFPLVKKYIAHLQPDDFKASERMPRSMQLLAHFLQEYSQLEIAQEEGEGIGDVEQVMESGEDSQQKPSIESKAEKADPKNQHSSVEGNNAPVIPRAWFDLILNPGGGDCLFHAAEGRTLDGEQMLETRAQVANVRAQMPDSEEGANYNAHVIAAAITQTPGLGRYAPMIHGRHQVPNRVLALMQAIPSVYAGPEELIQWCQLRNSTAIVVDQDGTVTRYTKSGSKQLFNLRTDPEKRTILRQIVQNSNSILLYKSPGHWERIRGLTGAFPDN